MKLRNATYYEHSQWLRFRRNPYNPGLTLRYQFKVTGDIEFKLLNIVLKDVLLNRFKGLLSYFLERGDRLLVGCNPLPNKVVDVVTNESEWSNFEQIDPESDNLFRFSCLIENESITSLKFEFSHLVFDGECYQPFLNAFSDYWHSHEGRSDQIRDEVGISFTQIAHAPVTQESVDYWKAVLQSARLFQPLPFCYKKAKEKGTYLTVKRTLAIKPTQDGERLAPIFDILEQRDVTLFQYVVAVTSAFIRLYSAMEGNDKELVTIAHTVNCRNEHQAYGCYTNVIPLFIKADMTQSGAVLLAGVKQARQAAYKHQHTPTQKLIEWADPRVNHAGRLFNLVVNASDGLVPYAVPELAGCKVELSKCPHTGGENELTINYSYDGEQLRLSFDSSSRFLSREALAGLADNFIKVAIYIATSPEKPLHECSISQPLTPVICGDRIEAAPNVRILEMVADSARLYANVPAISDEQTSLTYHQTYNAIGRLYSEIAEHSGILAGTAASTSVGVFLARTVAVPVAYLSALAFQSAFTPMDPMLPDERLGYMVDVSNVSVILVDGSTRARAAVLFPRAQLIDVSVSLHMATTEPTSTDDGMQQALAVPPSPDASAYVMFTSGSTGRPKGVAISVRNLANFLVTMQGVLGFQAGESILALTPISFDISILELLLPLICGGEVHIVSDQTRVSAELLGQALNQHKVDVAQATPSTWRMLQQAGWHATGDLTILCGGEALDKELAQYLLQQSGQLYNMYGPTEATIWSSCRRVTDVEIISLGQPVLNSEYYILDDKGESVAPGMQGELAIAGECVGKGYLNASSERFFVTLPNGVCAYKTGDIVHYLSHQDIEYVGRRDSQYVVAH